MLSIGVEGSRSQGEIEAKVSRYSIHVCKLPDVALSWFQDDCRETRKAESQEGSPRLEK